MVARMDVETIDPLSVFKEALWTSLSYGALNLGPALQLCKQCPYQAPLRRKAQP